MKKSFHFLLMAALVCGLSLGVTSCKDDDNNDNNDSSEESYATLTFDSDQLAHGIETDIQSAVIEVPVKASGTWTATLRTGKKSKEDPEWCNILDWKVSYEGNQTLQLAIDANLTKAGRTCYLVVGNGGEKYTTITVYQNTTYKGEDASNSSGQAFSDLGMGTGIDYDYLLNMKNKTDETREFDPTMVHGVNNIFNLTQITKLQAQGKLQPSAYVEAPIELDNLKAALLDSSVVQSKTITVSVELGVEFGVIAFKGKGGYESDKKEAKTHIDYTIVRQAPMYNVYLSPAELTAYAARNRQVDEDEQDILEEEIEKVKNKYNKTNQRALKKGKLTESDLDEDGLTEDQSLEIENMYDAVPVNFDHAGIFSSAFCNRYNELYNAITRKNLRNKPIDTQAADNTLSLLDSQFGPFYIDGGNFGGLMVVHARVDSMSQEGQTTFGGEISLDALGATITLKGDFSYTEDGYNAWHKIRPDFHIYGGNARDTSAKLLSILASGRPNDMTKWQGVLLDWIGSMESPEGDVPVNEQSKASPITFIIQPIWQIFNEPDIHSYVKEYFMKKYKNRGIEAWEKLVTGGVKPGADDLLNVNSPFWKKYGNF